MKDILIVSYECDRIGNYFKLCNQNLQDFIKFKQFNMNIHCTHNMNNRESLHSKLEEFSDDYIVSIYAHGEDDRIKNNENEDLINISDARTHYNNAIVYSTACYSANKLGVQMHAYNCKLFFGYIKKSYIVSMYKDTFIELDNFALKEILDNSNIDPTLLCEKINSIFDNRIEEMKKINLMVAPFIMHNKESYKIYKNQKEYPS